MKDFKMFVKLFLKNKIFYLASRVFNRVSYILTFSTCLPFKCRNLDF